MNCREIEELLADYLGGELDDEQRSAFEEHLGTCVVCQEQVGELHDTISALRRLDTVSMSVAARKTRDLAVVRRRPVILRIAVASLKAAALVAFGVLLGSQLSPDRQLEPVQPPYEIVVVESGIHPKWLELGRRVGSGGSSFTRNLAMIAGPRQN